ncbi:unnamed protein product [Rangifer tarandus platyrhynchus]|uniref:Histone H2A n=1 Tax=Rangifer tarandus platyrhynchus TaxID=3082113 RepID=A0ABN9A4T5_RANTA|nr:unnamed protein product [Rangifer tarandus platyrhynchus]
MSRGRHLWNFRCSKKHSRSTRAELQLLVSRVDRLLREGQFANRLSSETPMFLAGILLYLTANILNLAGKEARANHRICITPEHVQRALIKNEILCRLFEPNAFTRTTAAPTPRKKK